MAIKSFHFQSNELIAPVTALKIVGNKLFVGESAYLSIYDVTTTEHITIKRVLSNQRIHCIQVCDWEGLNAVAVCGGREASFLLFNPRKSELILEKTSSYNDWIWDMSILPAISETSTRQIILATAHNTVWLWNVVTDEKCKIAVCEEQCILYCARFFSDTLDSMWLACGTVYNEILLWKVNDTPNDFGVTKVRTRLPGHDGVIFSITYDKARNILCSVSDDRSVKIWKLDLDEGNKTTSHCVPMLTLYGHKARVWDCLILTNHIVTIGEDSMCLLWNFDGEIAKTFSGHTGKSIWSLTVDFQETILATGGGDGGVRLWTLNDEAARYTQHINTDLPQVACNITDNPRCLGFLANNDVLVLTEKGNIHKYLEVSEEWQLSRNEPKFCSYSVMALSPCRQLVAIGNIDGEIKLFSAVDEAITPLYTRPFTSKILSLHWLKGNESTLNLFICGPEGCILWWNISYNMKEIKYEAKNSLCLPSCRQRWPNAIFLAPPHLMDEGDKEMLVICGDRRGSLHLFDGSKTNMSNQIEPTHSHIGVHGNNGVTHITCHLDFIYTTGRDGYYRQYKLKNGDLMLIDKRKTYKGLDWIEQLFFTSDGDLLIIGFHAVDFIIWSRKSNTVLHRIACGGGHRVWDISYKNLSSQNAIMFTYLKKTTINIHKLPLKRETNNTIIQESFHGREATCVLFMPVTRAEEKGTLRVLVTGSEDTNINIMAYMPSECRKNLFKLCKCQGHISSVRCLALTTDRTHQWRYLLFSGGGRASLKCWSLNLDHIYAQEPGISRSRCDENPQAVCTLFAELPNRLSKFKKKRKNTGGCDIRFMSLSVFSLVELGTGDFTQFGVIAGCSDGLLRLYILDCETKCFRLLCEASWHDKCILTVGHIIFDTKQPKLVVYSADTAGRVAFWDLTDVFTAINVDFKISATISCDSVEVEGKYNSRLHNSSETGISITEETNNASFVRENFQKLNINEEQISSGKFTQGCGLSPFCFQTTHQSGVNCCSVKQLRDSGYYILCSGGDDGAVNIALFELRSHENNVFVKTWVNEKIHNAQTSSTTGVKIIDDDLILSTSVDQTLKLWKFDIDDEFSNITVALIGSHFVDVADVQDIDVIRNSSGSYDVVVCGVGIQVITLEESQ